LLSSYKHLQATYKPLRVAANPGLGKHPVPGLRYVGASVYTHVPRGIQRRGQVLWATDVDDAKVGVAWGWACLSNDAVVMLNPMSVTTNLALVDDSGDPLNFSQLMCCLNAIIYSLPWQQQVRTAT
jgi:hypothetical protein